MLTIIIIAAVVVALICAAAFLPAGNRRPSAKDRYDDLNGPSTPQF